MALIFSISKQLRFSIFVFIAAFILSSFACRASVIDTFYDHVRDTLADPADNALSLRFYTVQLNADYRGRILQQATALARSHGTPLETFYQTFEGNQYRAEQFSARHRAAQGILYQICSENPQGLNIVPFQEAVFEAVPIDDRDAFYPFSHAVYQSALSCLSPARPCLMAIPGFSYYKYVPAGSLELYKCAQGARALIEEGERLVGTRSLFNPLRIATRFEGGEYQGYVKNKSVVLGGGVPLWSTQKAYHAGDELSRPGWPQAGYSCGSGIMAPKRTGFYGSRERIEIPAAIQAQVQTLMGISICADYADWALLPRMMEVDHRRGPLFRIVQSDTIDSVPRGHHSQFSAVVQADPFSPLNRAFWPSPSIRGQEGLPELAFLPPLGDPTGIFTVRAVDVKPNLPAFFGPNAVQIWRDRFAHPRPLPEPRRLARHHPLAPAQLSQTQD